MKTMLIILVLIALKPVLMQSNEDWGLFCNQQHFDYIDYWDDGKALQEFRFHRETYEWNTTYNPSTGKVDLKTFSKDSKDWGIITGIHLNHSNDVIALNLDLNANNWFWEIIKKDGSPKQKHYVENSKNMQFTTVFVWNQFQDLYVSGGKKDSESDRTDFLYKLDRSKPGFDGIDYSKPLIPLGQTILQFSGRCSVSANEPLAPQLFDVNSNITEPSNSTETTNTTKVEDTSPETTPTPPPNIAEESSPIGSTTNSDKGGKGGNWTLIIIIVIVIIVIAVICILAFIFCRKSGSDKEVVSKESSNKGKVSGGPVSGGPAPPKSGIKPPPKSNLKTTSNVSVVSRRSNIV